MDALLPLERFAALSAEIESGLPRDAVLYREGLSPEQWEAFEAMWRARIEDDISHGSFELTNRYNAAFVARREELRYETPQEPAVAVGYGAEAMGHPVPTPRMTQEQGQTPAHGQMPPWMMQAQAQEEAEDVTVLMGERQPPPPTPRMMEAEEVTVTMGANQGPPPTPRMRQAPEPSPMASGVERGMTRTQPMQAVPGPRGAQAPEAPPRRSTPPPLPRAALKRPEVATAGPELGDRTTPVPDTLRPGMALPVGPAGDRLTPPPSTQEDRPGGFDDATPPPSSRPPTTPRQEALDGPRLDGLPFRPAFAASDAPPRSTNDLSDVLPFKPVTNAPPYSAATVSAPAVSNPAMSSPAMSPPAASPPQSPWSGQGTGTAQIAAPYAQATQPGHAGEVEIEVPAPISTHAIPVAFGEVAELGPPVLTGPGTLAPAPIVFPFALWRRSYEPQAYAAPVYAQQPQFAPASVAQPHPPQALAPQAAFPHALPAAGPANAPLLSPPNAPPILTVPASAHLAPPSARQTLPPNLVSASPVTPFLTSASAPAPQAQPSQSLAVPAVLGASTSRLSLEQYASLSAEIAISPGTSAAVRARYGLDENSHVAETGLWQRRFSADKDLFTRYSALYQSYREWFSRSAR